MKNNDFYYNRLSELKKFVNHYKWIKDNYKHVDNFKQYGYNINIRFSWVDYIKKFVVKGQLEYKGDPFTIYLDADDIEYLYAKYKPKHDEMVCDESIKELARMKKSKLELETKIKNFKGCK